MRHIGQELLATSNEITEGFQNAWENFNKLFLWPSLDEHSHFSSTIGLNVCCILP